MRRTDRGFCAGVPAVGQEGDPCFLQGIRSVPTNHFNMHDVANAELYDKTAALNRLLLFLPSNEERALRCFTFSRKVTVELEQRGLAAERKAQLRAGRLIALAAQFRLLRKYRLRAVPPSPSPLMVPEVLLLPEAKRCCAQRIGLPLAALSQAS